METNPHLGVTWHKTKRKWKARIRHLDQHINLGWFQSAAEAARVWDCAARMLRGDATPTNFDGDPPLTKTPKEIRAFLRSKNVVA